MIKETLVDDLMNFAAIDYFQEKQNLGKDPSIDCMVRVLNKIKKVYTKKGFVDIRVTQNGYDDVYMVVQGDREETDEEFKVRSEKETLRQAKIDNLERKEYERLQKKFSK